MAGATLQQRKIWRALLVGEYRSPGRGRWSRTAAAGASNECVRRRRVKAREERACCRSRQEGGGAAGRGGTKVEEDTMEAWEQCEDGIGVEQAEPTAQRRRRAERTSGSGAHSYRALAAQHETVGMQDALRYAGRPVLVGRRRDLFGD